MSEWFASLRNGGSLKLGAVIAVVASIAALVVTLKDLTLEQLGLVILAVSEVPNFLAGVLPSLMTIRTFASDPEQVSALRHGEVVGGTMALAVGAGASMVSRKWAPFLACSATLAAFLYQYEMAIRNPITKQKDMKAGAR